MVYNLRDNAGSVSIVAIYAANQYTYKVNVNDGATAVSSKTAAYDTVYSIAAPTRANYVFLGWNVTGMDSTIHSYGFTNAVTSSNKLSV